MLNLSLDKLFTPDIVAAFQAQWSASPDAAAAQAEATVQMIVSPEGDRETMLAELIVALVGPEPDGLAWMEALAVGSFKLRDNVTYAIGRVGESPAKFIDRQRQRIADLAGHPRAGEHETDIRNAYNDALRLIVATTLLTQLRTGVAAKAAIGAGWPLMAAVKRYCSEDEKRALYWFGNDADLQRAIADAIRPALEQFRERQSDPHVSRRANYDRTLPPGADLNAFFRPEERARLAPLLPASRRTIWPTYVPDFIRTAGDPNTMDSAQSGRALWRAHILLAGLHGATSGSYAFAMALRSSRRRQLRDAWLDGSSDTMPTDFQVQSAISTHIADGGFLPPDIPLEYVHYVEEDACYAFHEIGDSWSGLRRWQDANFFLFDRDPTRLDKLEGL